MTLRPAPSMEQPTAGSSWAKPLAQKRCESEELCEYWKYRPFLAHLPKKKSETRLL